MHSTMSSPASSSAHIGVRLDRMPITRFHRRLLFAIGAGLLVDSVDVYLTAGVSAALVKQQIADLNQAGHLAIATAVGLGFGGFFAGLLGDKLGRRRIMQWTILLVTLGGFGAALSTSMAQLLAWRLVSALGLGGESVLGYAMLGEFVPPQRRGTWMARLGLIANCGMPLGLVAGLFILPHPSGWRWMLAIPAVLAIFVFVLRRSLSESPRWLAATGRPVEADLVVSAIEQTVMQPLPPLPAATLVSTTAQTAGMAGLLSREGRGKLTAAIAINIAIMTAIFGFVSWLPTFFAASGRDVASSAFFACLMSLGAPIGTMIGMVITDRVERKWGVVATALLTAALGGVYVFTQGPDDIIVMGFLVVTTIYVFGTLGLVGYVPELFPTALRIRGIGLSATIGRLTIIGLPMLVVPVFKAAGQAGVIALIAAIMLAAALVVAVFGVPTRGRSLECV